jgi:hypothetical protein
MSKFFKNRTADEWRAVLTGLGFKWTTGDGDDEGYTHPEAKAQIVVFVPNRNETIILPTSLSMARKVTLARGVSKKEINKWWKDNGYGE